MCLCNSCNTAIIDRTAKFIAQTQDPRKFEDKIRETQRQDPKFSFLNSADPYNAYYRHRMEKVARGEVDDEPAAEKEGGKEAEQEVPEREIDRGLEPPTPEFIYDEVNISAIDMYVLLDPQKDSCFNFCIYCRDTMKLTALFTARRGRSFLAALSAKEGRNYQFDFLRPTHSLFGYFNHLVEQYSKIILPSKEMLEKVKERAQPSYRWTELEIARKRARWEQVKREQDKKRESDKEAEARA